MKNWISEVKNRVSMKKVKKHWVIASSLAVVALGTPVVFAQDSNDQSLSQEQMTELLALVNGKNSYQEWVANTVEEIKATIESQKVQNLDNYIIQWGDTLWAISQASGIPIDELVAINGIQNADLIYAGDTLKGVLNRIHAYAKQKEAQTVAIAPQQTVNPLQAITAEPVSLVSATDVAEAKAPTNPSIQTHQEGSQSKDTQPKADYHESVESIETETVKEDSKPQVIDKKEETIKVIESDKNDKQTTPSGVIEEKPATEGSSTEEQTGSHTVTETPAPSVKPTPAPVVPELPATPNKENEANEEVTETVPLTPLTPATPIEEVQPTIVKRTDQYVRTTPIHFGVQRIADPKLDKGVEKVVQEGKDGVKTETVQRYYENDQLISETVISTEVVEASPQVIHVGTKEAVPQDTVEVKKETTTESIPYKQVIKENPSLEKGKETLIQKGEEGQREIVEEVTYTNGKETNRKTISNQVIKEAVDEIIIRGTREVTETVPLTPLTPATPIKDEKPEPVVTTKEESHTETIPYEIVRQENKNLTKGVEQVVQPGVKGEKTITEQVTLTDGKETHREMIREEITQKPVNEVVEYGTKEEKQNDRNYLDGTQGYLIGDDYTNSTLNVHGKVNSFDIQTPENIEVLASQKNSTNSDSYYEKAKNDDAHRNSMYIKNDQTVEGVPVPLSDQTIQLFNRGGLIREDVLNDEFLQLLNAERKAKGLNPVKVNNRLAEGTTTRSQELANNGSIEVNIKGQRVPHVRLDGKPYQDAFSKDIRLQYGLFENLAETTYNSNPYGILSEKLLAEMFFSMWKSSPGHYANMMNPAHTGNYVSVKLARSNKYDFDILVATEMLAQPATKDNSIDKAIDEAIKEQEANAVTNR
ncbi:MULTISPECIES: G5 domain-containing protein [Aerococcus]|uniref:G5 domain-containing protein n=1 Tax=Aerococcus TaxID=1375 RepID=UPI0018A7CFBE|nr:MULTISPECIES: G5 domain-containing protein [Aerococcus]MCY3067590.1 G5 domain-containing protein [Aerococcus mictus]MCY3080875.1 G5 domain-containing protein [Aerococcus mictus]MDK8485480.1 G5 domain-containing protein [Aerococcus urinae]